MTCAVDSASAARAHAVASEAAYEEFARRHLALGFTDISVVPEGVPAQRLRKIADVIPVLRAEATSRP